MDERLQNMLDHFEITKTLSEYCHATDRCDREGIASVYAKDSWDDHGDVKAPGPEFAKVISESIRTTTRTLTHQLGQSLITIKGDHAGAETYFTAVATGPDERGVEKCNFLGGRFIDKLDRENGRWRIKHRTVLRDWTLSLPVDSEWIPALALTPGQRSNADASCAVIGWPHSNG